MLTAQELATELAYYHGCEQPFHQPLFPGVVYTDGVKFFLHSAGESGALWFYSIIASQPEILNAAREATLTAIRLFVDINGNGRIVVDNDAVDEEYIVHFEREVKTDIQHGVNRDPGQPQMEPHWKFWMAPTIVGDKEVLIVMLPGEN